MDKMSGTSLGAAHTSREVGQIDTMYKNKLLSQEVESIALMLMDAIEAPCEAEPNPRRVHWANNY